MNTKRDVSVLLISALLILVFPNISIATVSGNWTFHDGAISKNITFSVAGNQSFYVDIPRDGYINNYTISYSLNSSTYNEDFIYNSFRYSWLHNITPYNFGGSTGYGNWTLTNNNLWLKVFDSTNGGAGVLYYTTPYTLKGTYINFSMNISVIDEIAGSGSPSLNFYVANSTTCVQSATICTDGHKLLYTYPLTDGVSQDITYRQFYYFYNTSTGNISLYIDNTSNRIAEVTNTTMIGFNFRIGLYADMGLGGTPMTTILNIKNISSSQLPSGVYITPYNASDLNLLNINTCTCSRCRIVSDSCRINHTAHSDTVGSISINSLYLTWYKQFMLIDEKENTRFNVMNLSSVRLYADDNNSVFDFKAQNTNTTNFTIFYDKYRLELVYSDNSVITRYIDTDLVDSTIRLCANKDGVTHYEQLIISNIQKAAKMLSVYANCLVAADYTRFAYQNAYLLKAYTIDTSYNLYTYPDGVETVLVGIDGSIASYVNVDTIEFQQEGVDVDILGSVLSIDKSAPSTMRIYYKNQDSANTALEITITRMDTNTQLYTQTSFSDMDEATIYFDYSTLNVNDTVLFMIKATSTNADGTTITKRYFNNFGGSGIIPSAIGFVIALMITIFGFTMTSVRVTFGIFGIIVNIISILILAVSTAAWYVYFMMAMNFILLVYTIIIMAKQTGSGVLS